MIRLAAAALIVLVTCGCFDNKIRDPQLTNLRLTSDLLESLSKNDHKAAAIQAAKLKAVIPESTFLSQLEESEISNIYIIDAQQLLDKGDLKGSLKTINKGISEHPMNRHLMRCRQQLIRLGELEAAIKETMNYTDAATLNNGITRLKEMTNEFPKPERWANFIKQKENEVASREKYEVRRAYHSLWSEYRTLKKTEPELAKILAAQIQYDPNSLSIYSE